MGALFCSATRLWNTRFKRTFAVLMTALVQMYMMVHAPSLSPVCCCVVFLLRCLQCVAVLCPSSAVSSVLLCYVPPPLSPVCCCVMSPLRCLQCVAVLCPPRCLLCVAVVCPDYLRACRLPISMLSPACFRMCQCVNVSLCCMCACMCANVGLCVHTLVCALACFHMFVRSVMLGMHALSAHTLMPIFTTPCAMHM